MIGEQDLNIFQAQLSRDILQYVNPENKKTLNTRRIRILRWDYTRRCKRSPKLRRWYWPNSQYLTKYRAHSSQSRPYDVKNIFLSELTITNRLPEQLIKIPIFRFVI